MITALLQEHDFVSSFLFFPPNVREHTSLSVKSLKTIFSFPGLTDSPLSESISIIKWNYFDRILGFIPKISTGNISSRVRVLGLMVGVIKSLQREESLELCMQCGLILKH